MSLIVRVNETVATIVESVVLYDLESAGTSTEHELGQASAAVDVACGILNRLQWTRTMRFAYRPASSDSRSPSIWMRGDCALFIENDGSIVPFFAEDFRDYSEPRNDADEIASLIKLGVPSRGK